FRTQLFVARLKKSFVGSRSRQYSHLFAGKQEGKDFAEAFPSAVDESDRIPLKLQGMAKKRQPTMQFGRHLLALDHGRHVSGLPGSRNKTGPLWRRGNAPPANEKIVRAPDRAGNRGRLVTEFAFRFAGISPPLHT